jgi:hypothetical protein
LAYPLEKHRLVPLEKAKALESLQFAGAEGSALSDDISSQLIVVRQNTRASLIFSQNLYAHLAPEHLADAAKRVEREWSVAGSNPTIALREQSAESFGSAKTLNWLARPERFELPAFWFVV